jgi:DNA repair protein RadC
VDGSSNGHPPESDRVEYRAMIRDLPADERPRERLLRYGAEALSTPELLAIIWRTGTSSESVLSLATRALADAQGLVGLHERSIPEITRQKGVGEAKAIELKAALEIGRRLLLAQPQERPTVRSPADVYNQMAEMAFFDQEHLRVLLMNTKNHVLHTNEIYRGSVNQSQVRIAELFKEAVRRNCNNIILVHNHPSGDPTPSTDDVRLTEQVVKAGDLLDIKLLDHIVIGRQRYVSLKERGLGFR